MDRNTHHARQRLDTGAVVWARGLVSSLETLTLANVWAWFAPQKATVTEEGPWAADRLMGKRPLGKGHWCAES